jgi:hypothetical protein
MLLMGAQVRKLSLKPSGSQYDIGDPGMLLKSSELALNSHPQSGFWIASSVFGAWLRCPLKLESLIKVP